MFLQEEELVVILLGASLTVVVLIGFILLLVLVFNRNMRQRERQAFLQVLAATEKERQIIGQNLHDDIGPMLAGLKLGMGILSPAIESNEKLLPIFEEQKKVLSQTISAVRNSAHQLMPGTLLRYGLIAALEERCNQLISASHWKINLRHQNFPANITKDNSLNLFRIITELLHNSIKHAGGNLINISLDGNQKHLTIAYSDNGKEFDPAKMNDGLGLSGIKTRIALMQGTYTLGEAKAFEMYISFKIEHLQ